MYRSVQHCIRTHRPRGGRRTVHAVQVAYRTVLILVYVCLLLEVRSMLHTQVSSSHDPCCSHRMLVPKAQASSEVYSMAWNNYDSSASDVACVFSTMRVKVTFLSTSQKDWTSCSCLPTTMRPVVARLYGQISLCLIHAATVSMVWLPIFGKARSPPLKRFFSWRSVSFKL